MIAIVAFVVVLGTTSGMGQQPSSTYDAVKSRGTLIAGVKADFPPAGFYDKAGQLVGFDVDVVKYIAAQLGVKPEIKVVTSQSRIPELVNGNVDLVAAVMNATSERAKVIDFSIVYYSGGQTILVHKNSGIRSVADLAAPKTTAVTQGSADGPGFLAFQPNGKLVYFQEHPQAVLALVQGRVDAVTTTDITLRRLAHGHPSLAVIEPPFKPDPWVIGVRQNDSKWRLFIDDTLMQMWVSGEYEKIFKADFGFPVPADIRQLWHTELWPNFFKPGIP